MKLAVLAALVLGVVASLAVGCGPRSTVRTVAKTTVTKTNTQIRYATVERVTNVPTPDPNPSPPHGVHEIGKGDYFVEYGHEAAIRGLCGQSDADNYAGIKSWEEERGGIWIHCVVPNNKYLYRGG